MRHCLKHPRYQAIRKPRTQCETCQAIWKLSNTLKSINSKVTYSDQRELVLFSIYLARVNKRMQEAKLHIQQQVYNEVYGEDT